MNRAAWLLAILLPLASGTFGSAELELQPQAGGAQVRLCFLGEANAVSYELLLEMRGPAGIARTRQAGDVRDAGCPVLSRLGAAPGSLLRATLTWQRQGQVQPVIERLLPL